MNKELIEQLKSMLTATDMKGRGVWLGRISNAITALESQPFDVLQHLRDGGTVEDEAGNLFTYGGKGLIVTFVLPSRICTDDQKSSFLLERIMCRAVHIYHEPPAEGSREWAMAQEDAITHTSWIATSYVYQVTMASYPNSYKAAKYNDGWSLHVETREPGYCFASRPNGPQSVPLYWGGKEWLYFKGDTPCEEQDWEPMTRQDGTVWMIDAPEDKTPGIFGSEGEAL